MLGVYDKGKAGTVVETQQEIVSEGKVYSRAVGSGFFIGQGGWGGPKGESKAEKKESNCMKECVLIKMGAGPSTVNYAPPKGKKPDVVHEVQLSKEAALLYR